LCDAILCLNLEAICNGFLEKAIPKIWEKGG